MTKGIILVVALLCSLYCTGIQAYSVSGNKILDPNGNPIILRGVDRCSLEWAEAGQYLSLADYTLMKGWGANVVRLSLNQDFWLESSTSSSYQATVDQQVTWITTDLGMGVILDLHWSDKGVLGGSSIGQQTMADSNSLTFWLQVATKYKNKPLVIFELYNEPHDVSWSIWRNGGYDSGSGFTIAGMQQLYNVVRVNASANNVVIINGLNWAYDLSGIAGSSGNYAITGTNIVYGTHPYDSTDGSANGKQPTDWPTGFGYLAATYPVFATEFGQYCTTGTYVQQLLAYFQANGIHWTAWAWWVQDCTFPSLISDWNGDALAPAGPLVKSALGSSAAAATTATTSTTKAPTTSSTTKSATTSTSSTTKAASTTTTTTTGSSSGGVTATLTFTVNSGTDANWIGINEPVSGIPSGYATQTVYILQSGTWQPLTDDSWAYVYATSTNLVPPLSIKFTATNGKSATLTNVITSLTGAQYTVTATYQ